jgi:hypothetical protein
VPQSEDLDAETYTQRFGVAPERDDLERVNCPVAGMLGHWQCGICSCGKPRVLCGHVIARLQVAEADYQEMVKKGSISPIRE